MVPSVLLEVNLMSFTSTSHLTCDTADKNEIQGLKFSWDDS